VVTLKIHNSGLNRLGVSYFLTLRYKLFCIAMATKVALDLSNTVLRCEPCKIYNLTQLQCLLNKISGLVV